MAHSKALNEQTGVIAEAFFIANLLFVGVFYVALWGLSIYRYKHSSQINKSHIRQAIMVSSTSVFIVIIFNLIVLFTTGYASVTALILAEIYYMFFVPVFLYFGINAFVQATNGKDYHYPIIGKFVC